MPTEPISGAARQEYSRLEEAEMGALGLEQVQAALDRLQLGIRHRRIRQPHRYIAAGGKQPVGCQLGQIVKSLGFMINKTTPVLVLASGDQSIDERKLAALFGFGRKEGAPDECRAVPRYPWLRAWRRPANRPSQRR